MSSPIQVRYFKGTNVPIPVCNFTVPEWAQEGYLSPSKTRLRITLDEGENIVIGDLTLAWDSPSKKRTAPTVQPNFASPTKSSPTKIGAFAKQLLEMTAEELAVARRTRYVLPSLPPPTFSSLTVCVVA